MTTRERLAKIEADRQKLELEAHAVRQAIRAHYGTLMVDLAVEGLTEREFRDVLAHAIRVGGGPAAAALKALTAPTEPTQTSPERRPSDEHGGAARRRPVLSSSTASATDGAGLSSAP